MDWPSFACKLLLADGKVGDAETALLRRAITADGKIDREEVEFLIRLKKEAVAVAPAFDEFLFAQLKRVVLVDGTISDAEAGWLDDTLFKDRLTVGDASVQFLRELKAAAKSTGARFDRLCAIWTAGK